MLRSELLGIDIASNNIKIILLEKKRKSYQINNIFVIPYPSTDQKQSQAKIISELIKDTLKKNNIKTRDAHITYSEKDIYYQHNSFPEMKKEDLIEAIRWMYRDQLDFNADTAIIEYIITKEFYENDSKKLELFITIVSRESIDSIATLAENAGLIPHLLSFTPFAFKELYSNLLKKDANESILWLEMESEFAVLNIIKKDQLEFARTIKYSSDEVSSVLNESTLIDKLYSLSIIKKLYNELKNNSNEIETAMKKRTEDKSITFMLIALASMFFIAGTALSLMQHRVLFSLLSYLIAILITSLYTLIILYPKNNIIFYPEIKKLLKTKNELNQSLKKHTQLFNITEKPEKKEFERILDDINEDLEQVEKLKASLMGPGGSAEIFVLEIMRSVAYYREKYGLENIEKIILSGCAAEIIGIDEYISKELGIHVEKFKISDYFQSTTKLTNYLEKNSASFVKLAGIITLNPRKTTNFIPLRIKEKTTLLKLITPTLALIVALFIFLFGIWEMVDRNYRSTKEINEFKGKQILALQPLKTRILAQKAKQDLRAQHILIVQQTIKNNLALNRILFEISQAISNTILLDEISLAAQSAPTTDTNAKIIKITGKINNNSVAAIELSEFIAKLKKSPAIAQIDLGYIKESESEPAQTSYKNFELLCILKNN